MSQPPKVVFIASMATSLINFRLHLMKALQAQGYCVVAFAPQDANTQAILSGFGIRFIEIPLSRNGINPFKDIILLIKLFWLLLKEKPQMVFSYTIKPVIFGSIAARLANVPKIYSMITGTGYIFLKESLKTKIVGYIAKKLFRFALQFNTRIIFQNGDNLNEFLNQHLIKVDQPVAIVNGSGVDITHFHQVPLPKQPSFIMIGRFLADKGIREYVEAARIIKQQFPDVQFKLAGWIDTNPASIKEEELQKWIKEGVINYLGRLEDVRPALSESAVYVLPSYAEGTPRTVLEAMALGRPIVTTNAPGCKETVIENMNGFLVPIKDCQALAKACLYFITNPSSITKMGAASRKLVTEKYDVHYVNKTILQAMDVAYIESEHSIEAVQQSSFD